MQNHDQDRSHSLHRPAIINEQIEDGEICIGTERKTRFEGYCKQLEPYLTVNMTVNQITTDVI